jgi:hypothetical protein
VTSAADSLFGGLSTGKKLTFALLVLGALAGAGLVWVSAARLHANLTATPDIVASDAAPQQTNGAWLERWWMDVQESVKHAE